jgi:NDP-sugar pyrophosphorylase family protein
MAGHSRRFKAAGYSDPKPFIDIDGIPMIQRVCQMFSPEDHFIFLCSQEHLDTPRYLRILENAVPRYKIVGINPHELGPVYTALQAQDAVGSYEEPIIISYCDFTMEWNYRRFLLNAGQYEGCIPVFNGFQPASFGDTYYAYVKANEQMEMIELSEKKSFTDNRSEEYASTGVYYFDHWNTFSYYANELIEKKMMVGSEYYCSLLFNSLVRDQHKVALFNVEKFICWGTPEDLEEYFFWSGYFTKCSQKIIEAMKND